MNPEPRTSSNSRIFGYEGFSAQVECSEEGDLDWLSEFLQPQFAVRGVGFFACRIRLVADPREWNGLRAAGPASLQTRRECYFLDTRIVRLPLWASAGRETVVFDDESDVFCAVSAGRDDVRLLKKPRKRLARLALMRVLREYAHNHVLHAGGMIFHAAAFGLGRYGVVVAGKKGCGKTSLLLHALRLAGAHYVSNDRVLVSREGDAFRIRGIPTIINLRGSTLRMFPELYRRLCSSAYNPMLTLQEAAAGLLGHARPWRQDHYTLSPAQLCELMEVTPRSQARLAAVLFPRVTNTDGATRLEALSGRRAVSSLLESLFRSGFARQSGSLFSVSGNGHVVTDGARRQFVSALAARVPCYVCHVGVDAYDDHSWLDGLRSQLDGSQAP